MLDDPANATKNLSTASFSNIVALLVELKSTAALKGSAKMKNLIVTPALTVSEKSKNNHLNLYFTIIIAI